MIISWSNGLEIVAGNVQDLHHLLIVMVGDVQPNLSGPYHRGLLSFTLVVNSASQLSNLPSLQAKITPLAKSTLVESKFPSICTPHVASRVFKTSHVSKTNLIKNLIVASTSQPSDRPLTVDKVQSSFTLPNAKIRLVLQAR